MPQSAPVLSSPRARAAKGSNFELNSWLFMRGSGVLLAVLVFGHLFVNLMTGDGIHAIDFAFVAGKWSSPFWQVWDLLMLWLAELHGMNGLRTIINDYATKPIDRQRLLEVIARWTARPTSEGDNNCAACVDLADDDASRRQASPQAPPA